MIPLERTVVLAPKKKTLEIGLRVPIVGTHTETQKGEGIHLNGRVLTCVQLCTGDAGTLRGQITDARPREPILSPQKI